MSTQTIVSIIKRNGQAVPFEKSRILRAIEKAFHSENMQDISTVATLSDQVVMDLQQAHATEDTIPVESVQDKVEEVLMKNGFHKIAKNFILYRERQKQKRQENILTQVKQKTLEIAVDENNTAVYDASIIKDRLVQIGKGLSRIEIDEIVDSVTKQIYVNITKTEIDQLVLSAVRERIEKHYDYSYLAGRILVHDLYKSILDRYMNADDLDSVYQSHFESFIRKGIELDMLTPELGQFDLEKLGKALVPERDQLFTYLGVQILTDRYFLRDRSLERHIYELPQMFWMRVAMGLSIQEENKEERAIEFYTVLSKMDLVSSTPTLFNSGTLHSQMSSCYINISDDSLQGIFKLFSDNAMLSKWAGGIGTDWTPVRATGSKIHGTNGQSQGVIPFIKIFNDVALAVNQGGKRKGAMCAYMEVWHLDFDQFVELKKNTGDERRRAHDINTAAWIPDLFLKRVQNNEEWTLFCPSDTPDLHDLYGKAFEERYEHYESQNLPRAKKVNALDQWRKMLTMLFETGHPWITFKDAMNVRNPQDHAGVIHSSNLCTEIALNTSTDETAVCNLASLNLSHMVVDGKLDQEKIEKTVSIGIRMLDNVIDNNFYPTEEARKANLKHRAIGLGIMGYQNAIYKMGFAYDSQDNMTFADRSMEMVSYYAILASSKLSKERGSYESYKGSKWDRGIFPIDSVDLLEKQRGEAIDLDRSVALDWTPVREHVKAHGMRNCNTMAIAPTATIANISGVYPCTEPAFKNIYMKENLSGNFVVINESLMKDLDDIGAWNDAVLRQIKLNNGSLQGIPEIPEAIRNVYKEVFEVAPEWIVESSARRMKWIDQSASTNIFINSTSGKLLNDTYMLAWKKGLKSTYYLRSLGATQVQKMSTEVSADADNLPKSEDKSVVNATQVDAKLGDDLPTATVPLCKLNDPTCEACE